MDNTTQPNDTENNQTPPARHRRMILHIVAALTAVILLAGIAEVIPFFTMEAGHSCIVYVYPGMSKAALADTLQRNLSRKFTSRVMMLDRMRSSDIEKNTGRYAINADDSPKDVWLRFDRHRQSPLKFTFNNIRTVDDFASRVGKTFCMDSAAMRNLLRDSVFCADMGFDTVTIATALIPDTYEFYWTATPEEVFQKIYHNYRNFWDGPRRAKAEELGLTPTEVSIIASIVEDETTVNNERPLVARLYMNRLARGMKLQADPTVKFAVGDRSLRRITGKHLQTNSPYNTYKFAGLPPGPIRLPEKSALDAVLNAPDNNYIYMCAREDFSGKHNFTDNYAEHLRNARRYQAELNRRGIK